MYEDVFISLLPEHGLNMNERCSVLRGLNAFAKSIGPGQPARTAQADLSRNFSLFLDFLHIIELFYIMI